MDPPSTLNCGLYSVSASRYLETKLQDLHTSNLDLLTCPGIGFFKDTKVPGYHMKYAAIGGKPTETHHELTVLYNSDVKWQPYFVLGHQPKTVVYLLGLLKKEPTDPFTVYCHLYVPFRYRDISANGVERVARAAFDLHKHRGGALIIAGDFNCRNVKWEEGVGGQANGVCHLYDKSSSQVSLHDLLDFFEALGVLF